jgi:hypothetical protein
MWRNYHGCGYDSKGYTRTLPPPPPPRKKGYTYHQLCDAMVKRTPITMGGMTGLLNGIAMEDGSGRSFILTMSVNCTTHNVYYKVV